MAYNKLNLQDGDTLKAEHLTHIEDGIAEAFMSQNDVAADIYYLKHNKAKLTTAWKNGNIDSTGNFVENATTRIVHDNNISELNKTVHIDVNTGYEYVRRFFDENYVYVTGDLAWQSTNATFVQNYAHMKVVLRKSDNTNITPSEAENILVYMNVINDMNDLSDKVWLTLGDSITARGWYQDLVKQLCGVNFVNYGIGGTCIAKKWSSTTNAFCTRYADMQDDCDFITVWGGVNDFTSNIPLGEKGSTDTMTFYGALKIMLDGLLTKYKGKKIGFVLTTPVNHTDTTLNYCFAETNTAGHTLVDYINAITDMCKDYAIPVLDLYYNSGINQTNMDIMTSNVAQTAPDGLHPSMLGMQFVKQQIFDFIKTKLLI